jgi:hypothetical protein
MDGWMDGWGAYHPLEVDQAEPLAYVIADDDQVRSKELPVLGAAGIVELEAVLAFAGTDLKNEGLVDVSEEGDGGSALEVLAPLAYSAAFHG